MVVRAEGEGGKKITQSQFTDKAWQVGLNAELIPTARLPVIRRCLVMYI